jgi:hypothetical protein
VPERARPSAGESTRLRSDLRDLGDRVHSLYEQHTIADDVVADQRLNEALGHVCSALSFRTDVAALPYRKMTGAKLRAAAMLRFSISRNAQVVARLHNNYSPLISLQNWEA